MTKSKLDYLAKRYGVSKKKKKKKKDERKELEQAAWLEQHDESEEEEGDGPVVVDIKEEHIDMAPKGKWEVEKVPDSTVVESERSTAGDGKHSDGNGGSKLSVTKQRFDSSSEGEGASSFSRKRASGGASPVMSGATKQRYDSSDEEDSKPTRHRYDSTDEDKPAEDRKRQRYDSSDDEDKDKMSSGHAAGLQTGSRFSKAEAKLQAKRREETDALVKQHGHGDTVVRDKKTGKRVASSAMDPARQKAIDEEKQRALNTGTVQKQQAAHQATVMASMQHASFARHADDSGLEEARRNTIRSGDPMAAFGRKTQKVQKSKKKRKEVENDTKPIYKGPPPKPNRFGIKPGFRWDGVSRGNGFEDKILRQRHSLESKKEEAYKYNASAM